MTPRGKQYECDADPGTYTVTTPRRHSGEEGQTGWEGTHIG